MPLPDLPAILALLGTAAIVLMPLCLPPPKRRGAPARPTRRAER
ncbi:hypothetical protein [Jannaschia ovalis]|uniref:Uncharacterized protein n=1 Tax=Jannaschia ovalis TaxID=3038773 RepID=A0ABY8LDQ7_9RHOB|nr:hypothetical protein [Jannaschia sp. GRR-S6-38]WGH79432.1 hypothetical protein P8627_03970 [Jannaschia sp. GRR-S6-38]